MCVLADQIVFWEQSVLQAFTPYHAFFLIQIRYSDTGYMTTPCVNGVDISNIAKPLLRIFKEEFDNFILFSIQN